MLRDSVTTMALPRRGSAAASAIAATRSGGRPSRSAGASGSIQARSSASTFWPKVVVPRLARRSSTALSRARSAPSSRAPGPDEHAVVESEHPLLLRRQAERRPSAAISASTRAKSARVHHRLGMVRREPRAQVALQRLDRVVGIGAGEVEEHRRHPVERRARRAPSPRWCWRRSAAAGIGGDRVDLVRAPRQARPRRPARSRRSRSRVKAGRPKGVRSSPEAAGSSRILVRPSVTGGHLAGAGPGSRPGRRSPIRAWSRCRGRRPGPPRGSIPRWSAAR